MFDNGGCGMRQRGLVFGGDEGAFAAVVDEQPKGARPERGGASVKGSSFSSPRRIEQGGSDVSCAAPVSGASIGILRL